MPATIQQVTIEQLHELVDLEEEFNLGTATGSCINNYGNSIALYVHDSPLVIWGDESFASFIRDCRNALSINDVN